MTATDTSTYGVIDVTFIDGSRLRIAAPAHGHGASTAAITAPPD